MKRMKTSVILAGLLAMALTACSSTRTDGTGTASMRGSSGQPVAGSSGSSGTYGATGSAQSSTGASGTATASTAAPNSTVTSIEVVPAPAAASSATVGSEVMGSSTSGTTGSSPTAERAYRITVRTDDGSTQVVTQNWMPSFKTGDRVSIVNGAIQR